MGFSSSGTEKKVQETLYFVQNVTENCHIVTRQYANYYIVFFHDSKLE